MALGLEVAKSTGMALGLEVAKSTTFSISPHTIPCLCAYPARLKMSLLHTHDHNPAPITHLIHLIFLPIPPVSMKPFVPHLTLVSYPTLGTRVDVQS